MLLPSQKIAIVGGCLILFSVIFGFVAFDQILRFGIRDSDEVAAVINPNNQRIFQQLSLRKRNQVRGIYLKLPIPLDFRVYFFNVSNPMEVQIGKTPELKEVGPYCYNEYKERIDVVDNDAEDSLTYSPYDIYQFNQERSGTLKDDDYVTILHPLVVGMLNKVKQDAPALLSIVNQAIPLLFPNIQSIYITAKVKDILFEGVEIDCTASEFAAKAVCSQVKTQVPGVKMSNRNNVFLLSLLGTRNATVGKRYTVARGISNSRDLGKLLEVDGKKEITLWSEKKCNKFKGTDGWIFPPFLTPEEGLWSHSADLCRNIQATFVKDMEYKGVNLRRYEANLGDMGHNEDEKCYCDTPKTCLRRGVFDLNKCLGIPIYVTLPHFLETDEIYLRQVQGLQPVREDHGIKINFVSMIAVPLEARIRIQFNLLIGPNRKITLMRNISEALHPILWVEDGVELEGPWLKKITSIFLVIETAKALRWVGIAIGIGLFGFSNYLYFKNKKNVQITPVHALETVAEELKKKNVISGFNGIKTLGDNKQMNSVTIGHGLPK